MRGLDMSAKPSLKGLNKIYLNVISFYLKVTFTHSKI